VPDSAVYPLQPAGEPEAAPAAGSGADQPLVPMKAYLRQQELAYLNRVIQQCGGNKEEAAIRLGMSVATMYRRLSADEKEA
jgi:DNA-binding NtrC family response regulator